MLVRRNAKASEYLLTIAGDPFTEGESYEAIKGSVEHYPLVESSDFLVLTPDRLERHVEMACFDPVDEEAKVAYAHPSYRAEGLPGSISTMSLADLTDDDDDGN